MSNSVHTEKAHDSILLLFSRIYWMGLGPLLLLLILVGIAGSDAGWLTGLDLAAGLVLLSLPLVRWLEFRTGKSQTADGEPTTWAHFQSYSALVLLLGAIGWTIANLLGNHLLAG